VDRNGLIKGTDFLHFYTLGNLALERRGDLLYDSSAQAALSRTLIPEAVNYFYVPLYGPQVSVFFAPFSRLPYLWALAVWISLNIAVYAFCCFAVWRNCPSLEDKGSTIAILATAFPGFFHLVVWGQTSVLALLSFTLAYVALRSGHPVFAGVAIGSLIFKPQLGLAAAVIFLFAREWLILLSAVITGVAQLATGWLYYGRVAMERYFDAVEHIRDVLPLLEPRTYQTHSLRSFWSLLVPWSPVSSVLYAATAILTLVIAVQCWRSGPSLEIKYSSLLLVTVLVAPHLTVYDLVILAPAFLFLGDWAIAHPQDPTTPAVQSLLYLSYPLFLAGPLARVTHLQLSVGAMGILLCLIWRLAIGTESRAATLE
jgi:hypothetical protein